MKTLKLTIRQQPKGTSQWNPRTDKESAVGLDL